MVFKYKLICHKDNFSAQIRIKNYELMVHGFAISAIDFLLTLLYMQHADLIKRFEELLANNTRSFFDSDEFDILIDYYLTSNQYQKALKAVDFALEQYPYSIDFL